MRIKSIIALTGAVKEDSSASLSPLEGKMDGRRRPQMGVSQRGYPQTKHGMSADVEMKQGPLKRNTVAVERGNPLKRIPFALEKGTPLKRIPFALEKGGTP